MITSTVVIYVLFGKVLLNGAPVIAPRTIFCPQIYGHVTAVSAIPAAYYGKVRSPEKELNRLQYILGEHVSTLIESFASKCIRPTDASSLTSIFICVPFTAKIPKVYQAAIRLDKFGLHGLSLSDILSNSKHFQDLPPPVKYMAEWHAACKSISMSKTVLVVGPQGTGKSVFARILANFKTCFYNSILFIDADCRNGESFCPSVLSASVLQSGYREKEDFPLMGQVFTYHVPYGYTSVSSDPDTFVSLIELLIKVCTSYLQQQENYDPDIQTIINMPVWFQGTMDSVIENCVANIKCDTIIEMATKGSVHIVLPSTYTTSLVSWDQTERRTRDNSLVFTGVRHYLVHGLVGLPGMDHFRTLRFLQVLVNFRSYGLALDNLSSSHICLSGRDLIYTAPFIEIVTAKHPLTYVRIEDIVAEMYISPTDGATVHHRVTSAPKSLSPQASTSILLSQSLYTLVTALPSNKLCWALQTIFCATLIYMFCLSTSDTAADGTLKFLGVGLIRNYNDWNPCIIAALPPSELRHLSVICLPNLNFPFFNSKILKGNLEGFTTNQSMANVIGYQTYGGKGPNLLPTVN